MQVHSRAARGRAGTDRCTPKSHVAEPGHSARSMVSSDCAVVCKPYLLELPAFHICYTTIKHLSFFVFSNWWKLQSA